MQLWIGRSHCEQRSTSKLIPGRGQSGPGAVDRMGGLGILRQRVTDTCTGDSTRKPLQSPPLVFFLHKIPLSSKYSFPLYCQRVLATHGGGIPSDGKNLSNDSQKRKRGFINYGSSPQGVGQSSSLCVTYCRLDLRMVI